MPEQRATPRTPVLLQGRILVGGGALACTVRDLSRGGARLSIANADGIPGRFWLAIGASEKVHQVTVTWREASELGVRFAGASA